MWRRHDGNNTVEYLSLARVIGHPDRVGRLNDLAVVPTEIRHQPSHTTNRYASFLRTVRAIDTFATSREVRKRIISLGRRYASVFGSLATGPFVLARVAV